MVIVMTSMSSPVACLGAKCLPPNLQHFELLEVKTAWFGDDEFGAHWPKTLLSLEMTISGERRDYKKLSKLNGLNRALRRLDRLQAFQISNSYFVMDSENCLFGALSRKVQNVSLGVNGFEAGLLSLLPRTLRSLNILSTGKPDTSAPDAPYRFTNAHLEGLPQRMSYFCWSTYVGELTPDVCALLPRNIPDMQFFVQIPPGSLKERAKWAAKRVEYYAAPRWTGLQCSFMTTTAMEGN